MPRLDHLRIALAHDWLVGLRGGELVLDRLARLAGPTVLYTLVADGRPLTPAIDACRVVTSPLQRLPGAARGGRRLYLPLMPWAVERLAVAPCDLLVSTSSAVMKSIRPPEGVPHLCYCHAPARYVWQAVGAYGTGAGWWRGLGLRLVRGRLRRWDRVTSSRVTRFVANSRHIAREIERCFDREAAVVHPPVRTAWFTPDPAVPREDWLLVAGALEPYKRVDLAIEAARRGGWRLKVAGTGSQARALTRRARGAAVDMLGWVDGTALRDLYRRARALLYPQVEDFGISAVEAQACGCPVIAVAAGGALDTVNDRTGVLFEGQRVETLVDAVAALDRARINPAACRASAERFGEARFDDEMTEQMLAAAGGEPTAPARSADRCHRSAPPACRH